MKCPKCRFENPEQMQFCGNCGAKLESICPQCKSSNPPEFNFCGNCGLALREPVTAPTMDYSEPQAYTPKHLAEKILTTRSSIEGERKLVTVLFADVANFTSISEELDPEEIHRIMDGCFRILMNEIHRYEGTINQFTGDGVMALFGAPVAHEDHGQRACHAALSIQNAMGSYGNQLKKELAINFRMRIGLNSGPVVVGSIGDDLRMDYTAVGDTTNMASRMENMAGPGRIILSRHTRRLVRDYFEFANLGYIEVKGKKEPQEIFELLGTGAVDTRIAASAAKGLTRFVGRKNSIRSLVAAYNKARTGSGQVVGVVGDAGVGKSRLLLEFRNRFSRGEFNYFEGNCLPFGSSMAYLPVLDILRSYFSVKEGDPESLIKGNVEAKIYKLDDKLHRVLAPFFDLLSLDAEDTAYKELEPRQKRELIFEAIRDLIICESRIKPLVIVVEDLHWIDKTSEEFLDYLIGRLSEARILLLLLYRPEYTHLWGSKTYYNTVGLSQLTSESSADLIHSILQDGEAVNQLKGFVLERTSGNPLFMEELIHTLLENGAIRCEDGRCLLLKNATEIEVPNTIEGIIAARMDRLQDDIKRTMQVASVIGRDFAFRILETITEIKQGLKSYLLNLQDLEFIYEKSLFPELEYVFKHALTREVAYNSLLQQRRKEIHEKIGRAIESLYPDRIEEFYEILAHHYSGSDNFEKAYQFMELSGDKVIRNYSASEAFSYYKDAMTALEKFPESKENAQKQLAIIHKILVPMIVLGFPQDSLSILQAGGRIATAMDDKKSQIRFYSNIGVYYSHKGNHAEGLKYIEKAFEQAEKIQDLQSMAQTGIDIAITQMTEGAYNKAIDISTRVINLIEKTQMKAETFGGPSNVYSALKAVCGYSKGMLGDFEKALVDCNRAIENAISYENTPVQGFSEYYLAMVFLTRGDWKNAKVHLQKGVKFCEKTSFMQWLTLAWGGLGVAEAELGNPEGGIQHAEQGLTVHREANINWFAGYHFFSQGICHFYSQDLTRSIELLKEAYRLSDKSREHHYTGKSLIWLGRVTGLANSRNKDEALEYINRGLEFLQALQTKPDISIAHLFLGELYRNQGRVDQAAKYLKKAVRMFEEMGMDSWKNQAHKILDNL
ncbi:MAG: adenylate/guanylate cyclase domain-containing protein [Desulfobacterales bacterium]|nr:adenylate/guanylate cyclase domain-containing protein [Desulfobacterales bacterium]